MARRRLLHTVGVRFTVNRPPAGTTRRSRPPLQIETFYAELLRRRQHRSLRGPVRSAKDACAADTVGETAGRVRAEG